MKQRLIQTLSIATLLFACGGAFAQDTFHCPDPQIYKIISSDQGGATFKDSRGLRWVTNMPVFEDTVDLTVFADASSVEGSPIPMMIACGYTAGNEFLAYPKNPSLQQAATASQNFISGNCTEGADDCTFNIPTK